jgi:hypothetical protein
VNRQSVQKKWNCSSHKIWRFPKRSNLNSGSGSVWYLPTKRPIIGLHGHVLYSASLESTLNVGKQEAWHSMRHFGFGKRRSLMIIGIALAPRSSSAVMSFLALFASTAIAFTLAGCSNESRHRIIIYDHSWSAQASVKNLRCAPELSASCEQRATKTEAELSNRLAKAFRSTPECATVYFLVLSGNDKGSEDLEASLARNAWKFGEGYMYWRLRVDIHPGLTSQPFTLGPGKEGALLGGDGVEQNVSFMCEGVKHNGITAYW